MIVIGKYLHRGSWEIYRQSNRHQNRLDTVFACMQCRNNWHGLVLYMHVMYAILVQVLCRTGADLTRQSGRLLNISDKMALMNHLVGQAGNPS